MKLLKRIGIDPGTFTGLSITINGIIQDIFSTDTYEAIHFVENAIDSASIDNPLHIYFEDANLCKFRPKFAAHDKKSIGRLQGAGFIKGVCKIWQKVFEKFKNICQKIVRVFFINPLNNLYKKIKAPQFKRMTGWTKPTNQHGRDAHGLIYGLK